MAIAAVTAAIVFFVGRPFLPRPGAPHIETPAGSPIATAPTQPAGEAGPNVSADAGAAADARSTTASSADAAAPGEGRTAGSTTDGATVASGEAKPAGATPETGDGAPRPEAKSAGKAADAGDHGRPSEPPPQTGPGETAASRGASAEAQADKELARAAWRANRPDIRVSGSRSIILIPIKGTAQGAVYKYFWKTRAVVITLPHAASLNTMHFYRLKRHGFLTLWTYQDETNARAEDGTRLRLVVGVRAEPQVELHDDYVRITIPRPEAGHGAGTNDDDASDDSTKD